MQTDILCLKSPFPTPPPRFGCGRMAGKRKRCRRRSVLPEHPVRSTRRDGRSPGSRIAARSSLPSHGASGMSDVANRSQLRGQPRHRPWSLTAFPFHPGPCGPGTIGGDHRIYRGQWQSGRLPIAPLPQRGEDRVKPVRERSRPRLKDQRRLDLDDAAVADGRDGVPSGPGAKCFRKPPSCRATKPGRCRAGRRSCPHRTRSDPWPLAKLGFRHVESFIDDFDGERCERLALDGKSGATPPSPVGHSHSP